MRYIPIALTALSLLGQPLLHANQEATPFRKVDLTDTLNPGEIRADWFGIPEHIYAIELYGDDRIEILPILEKGEGAIISYALLLSSDREVFVQDLTTIEFFNLSSGLHPVSTNVAKPKQITGTSQSANITDTSKSLVTQLEPKPNSSSLPSSTVNQSGTITINSVETWELIKN
jgi:hypothetical protein